MANRGSVLALAGMVVLILACMLVVGWIGDAGEAAEISLVRDAVKNAALTCYAVEGIYPSDLGYLRAHYGLSYDESRYFVQYFAFASNLMPEISVQQRGADAP